MKKVFLLGLLLSSFLKGFAQIADLDQNPVVDSIVYKVAKAYSIVGLSIGIVANGKKQTKHFGHTDLSQQYPVSDSTLFHVASISKLFTATAILQLVEKQKLRLEDRLVDILPDFKMKDKRYTEIKIKHLLTHSSGLSWDNKLKESPDDESAIPLYIQHLQNKKLKFTPGEKMSYKTYSNVAFDLLGAVVAKVSGQKFEDYISEHILRPLKMSQTNYFYETIDSSQLAIPQIVAGDSKKIKRLNFFGIEDKKNPIVNGSPLPLKSYEVYGEEYEHNPSGNLISSAFELNLWMQQHLDLYANATSQRLLKKTTLKEMWRSQKMTPNKNISIGWGWWIRQDEKRGTSFFHIGNNPGFCSILMVYPEKNFGLTVLCNAWYAQEGVWYEIAEEIAKLYIGA